MVQIYHREGLGADDDDAKWGQSQSQSWPITGSRGAGGADSARRGAEQAQAKPPARTTGWVGWSALSGASGTTLLVTASVLLALVGCTVLYCSRRPAGRKRERPRDSHTYEMVEVADFSDDEEEEEEIDAGHGAKEVSAWSAEMTELDEEYGCSLDEEHIDEFATGSLEAGGLGDDGSGLSRRGFSSSGHGVEAL